jgi:hypothetical protein
MPVMREMLRKLSERERLLLYATLFLLFLFLVYQFGVFPFLRARDNYRIENAHLSQSLRELRGIAEKYAGEKSYFDELVRLLGSKKSLSVLTYLENVAGEQGIRDRIDYIRPKGTDVKDGITSVGVEMKIDGVEVSRLVMFLYGIEEKRNGLVVSYLRLKPFFKERGKVDAIVSVTDVVVTAPASGAAVSER